MAMPGPADPPQPSPNRDQLLAVGENVRALRNAQHLTLSQLAKRSGVSKAALSKLESATTNPTLETLTMLAGALSVTVAEIVTPTRASAVLVVRSNEGQDLSDSSLGARLIHTRNSPDGAYEVHDLELKPGQSQTSATHGEGSWEHVFVLDGKAWVGPRSEEVLLSRGDYATYRTHRTHGYRAEIDAPARLLVFLIGPRPH